MISMILYPVYTGYPILLKFLIRGTQNAALNLILHVELDYSKRTDGFRNELLRLRSDNRFDVRILRGPDSPPCHSVGAEELRDVDFYMLQGHRFVESSSLVGNKRLKWIGRSGAGFENVDIDACNESGVILTNAPFGLRESVAELVVTYILAFSTKLIMFNSFIREHHFVGKKKVFNLLCGGQNPGNLSEVGGSPSASCSL